MIGEQPGDQEDLAGHPFVGPAGRVMDDALDAAGISRDDVYITVHPSSLLRIPDPQSRRKARANFIADFKLIARLLKKIAVATNQCVI